MRCQNCSEYIDYDENGSWGIAGTDGAFCSEECLDAYEDALRDEDE